jgi:hypothetical protein
MDSGEVNFQYKRKTIAMLKYMVNNISNYSRKHKLTIVIGEIVIKEIAKNHIGKMLNTIKYSLLQRNPFIHNVVIKEGLEAISKGLFRSLHYIYQVMNCCSNSNSRISNISSIKIQEDVLKHALKIRSIQ